MSLSPPSSTFGGLQTRFIGTAVCFSRGHAGLIRCSLGCIQTGKPRVIAFARLDPYFIYPRQLRPGARPADERLHRGLRALQHGLHRAVAAVAHPAGHAQFVRLVRHGLTEENTWTRPLSRICKVVRMVEIFRSVKGQGILIMVTFTY